jgi:hypothetical protein
MSCLKRFDYFPKFTADGIARPTLIGTILSFTAIFIMGYLLYKEYYDYINASFTKETVVHHYSDQKSKIRIYMQMHMYHMPCTVLSVDQEDALGNRYIDIHERLIKHRYDKNHTVMDEYITVEPNDTINSIDNDEHCQISGSIEIDRVPGIIHISNLGYKNHMKEIQSLRPNLYPRITLSHKIKKFEVGNSTVEYSIYRRFGHSEYTDYSRFGEFPNQKVDNKHDFYYYMKIIPYLFVDEEKGTVITAYQYSLNFERNEYTESNKMHEIRINYDFSPLTMKITRKKKYLWVALGNVCAIVGGVFVIFNLLNKLLIYSLGESEIQIHQSTNSKLK